MAVKRPVVLYSDGLKELLSTDTLPDPLPPGSEPIFRNGSSAAYLLTATDTILLGSVVDLPAAALVLGSVIINTLMFTCSNTGTGILTLVLRGGALGTIADPVIQTFTFPAATSGSPSGRIDIATHIRSVGAAAQSYGHVSWNKSGTAGIGGATQSGLAPGVAGTTFTTAPAMKLSLSGKMSAAPATTIQTCAVEVQL